MTAALQTLDWAFLWTALTILHEALVAVAAFVVLRRPREPRAMWAWLLALFFLPIVGLLLFVLFGEPRIHRTRRRRKRRHRRFLQELRQQVNEGHRAEEAGSMELPDPVIARIMHLATRVGRRDPTRGNRVTIYHDAAKTHDALYEAIAAAAHHVHLEYYIFQPDETGARFRDLLIEKARQGVRCRVLLDAVGSWTVSHRFLKPARAAGVEIGWFMPVIPWSGRIRVNFRNHRKIAVIDGAVGFTGSQNIGNEYSGRRTKYGPWRDTHMRVVGPAVHHLQEVFIDDWYFANQGNLTNDRYFPDPLAAGDQVVQVIASGPDRTTAVLHQLIFAAVSAAQKTIRIVTPYFVPDTAMLYCFQSAAYRGVTVQLMIPSRTDSRIVLWAGRSYYNDLCAAGVEVYEYPGGMLHSKVIIVDGQWGVVGSANMDERSLRLNFELSTLLYDHQLAQELTDDFDKLRGRARRIRFRHHRDFRTIQALKLGLARLVSPIL